MRVFRRALLVLSGTYVSLGLILPGGAVTSSYPSLAEARADRLFASGAAPDILPPSARHIRAWRDPQRDTTRGEFWFRPDQYAELAARVVPSDGNFNAPLPLLQRMAHMRRQGYEVVGYPDGPATWLFFCRPAQGYCEYLRWVSAPVSS